MTPLRETLSLFTSVVTLHLDFRQGYPSRTPVGDPSHRHVFLVPTTSAQRCLQRPGHLQAHLHTITRVFMFGVTSTSRKKDGIHSHVIRINCDHTDLAP